MKRAESGITVGLLFKSANDELITDLPFANFPLALNTLKTRQTNCLQDLIVLFSWEGETKKVAKR